MREHIRHVARSAGYNRRLLVRPGRALALAAAWYRNEVAFLRRTARLGHVLDVDAATLGDALREAVPVMEHCAARLRRHGAVYPGLLNPNYGPLLYAATRLLRPAVVVETGVGSGVSSTFFLSALEKNGKGRLHSIDLPIPRASLLPSEQQTGWLVPDELRPRWELTLGDARRHLPELLERLREIDFFYHDSDHRHAHMTWEYTTAYPHIRPDGLLLSDDVTSNRAWNDFTTPLAGTTTRINRTGIHRKPGTATTR